MTIVPAYAGRAARGSEGLIQSAAPRSLRGLAAIASVEDWVTFALMLAMLWSLGWSVWLANWGDLPSLLPTLTLGATVAFGASRLKLHWSAKLTAAVLIGFAVIMWQGSIPADGSNIVARARDGWDRFWIWIEVARDGGISIDTVPFALMFMLASWVTSYVVTALTLSTKNPWAPVGLLGFGLMTNLSYRQGLYEQTFYLFIVAAVALFAHITTVRRLTRWRAQGIEYPSSLRWLSIRDGALLAVAVVSIAAVLPTWEPRNDALKHAWEFARTPINALRDPAGRLLAGVRGLDEQNPLGIPSENLAFRGPISLTDQPLFWVKSRFQTMYPGRVYQEYTPQGWMTGQTTTARVGARSLLVPPPSDEARQRVEQVIEPLVPTDLVLPVGGVYQLDRPAEVQYLQSASYTVPLSGPVATLVNLPEDLREAAFNLRFDLLREANGQPDGRHDFVLGNQPAMSVDVVQARAESVMPNDVRVTILRAAESEDLAGSLVLQRKSPKEEVGVQLPEQLDPRDSYAVTTYVVTASDDELAAAGTDYPAYIADRYLQLPATLPPEVRQLATKIVQDAGAVTPLEKVAAIKNFLQDQVYSQEIKGPAPDVDGMYYFLFQTQAEPCASAAPACDMSKIKGYSQYFGSAATVMFRAAGVPARMVSGWASGDYDSAQGRFLVKDSNRHGWSQAYFPGYGWIDVEVTPDHISPNRGEVFSVLPANIVSGEVSTAPEDEQQFEEDQAELDRLAREALARARAQVGQPQDASFPWWAVWTSTAAFATLAVSYAGWWFSLRGLASGRRSYTKLLRVAWLFGFGREEAQSASEYAASFRRISPRAMEAASIICAAFVIETYARPGTSSGERGQLEAAWRSCVLSMITFRTRQIVGMIPEIGEARSNA